MLPGSRNLGKERVARTATGWGQLDSDFPSGREGGTGCKVRWPLCPVIIVEGPEACHSSSQHADL